MTFVTERLDQARIVTAAPATMRNEARPLIVSGRLWRATVVVGDLLGVAGIVLCIPFVILAIGTPIVLLVRLLVWIAGLL